MIDSTARPERCRDFEKQMRVALSSKETLFGEALASLLDAQGRYEVVARESDPRSLVIAAKENRAQLLVVDSFRLDVNDLQYLLGARAFGEFGVVLIVADDDRKNFAELPVDRIVDRSAGSAELFEVLEDLCGKIRVGSVVRETRRKYGAGNDLTNREFEVAQLVAKGMSNRKISQVTGLREQSIKNLVSVIMRKLHCENRVQVALKLTRSSTVASPAEA
jgi:DNA-binding NarL/FixJ family response regulator